MENIIFGDCVENLFFGNVWETHFWGLCGRPIFGKCLENTMLFIIYFAITLLILLSETPYF